MNESWAPEVFAITNLLEICCKLLCMCIYIYIYVYVYIYICVYRALYSYAIAITAKTWFESKIRTKTPIKPFGGRCSSPPKSGFWMNYPNSGIAVKQKCLLLLAPMFPGCFQSWRALFCCFLSYGPSPTWRARNFMIFRRETGTCIQCGTPQWCLLVYNPHQLVRYIYQKSYLL